MYFNSHPCVGGDPEPLNIARVVDISIRTPAWGVTINRELGTTIILFQFAPRVGGDQTCCRKLIIQKFQFAPPRGG